MPDAYGRYGNKIGQAHTRKTKSEIGTIIGFALLTLLIAGVIFGISSVDRISSIHKYNFVVYALEDSVYQFSITERKLVKIPLFLNDDLTRYGFYRYYDSNTPNEFVIETMGESANFTGACNWQVEGGKVSINLHEVGSNKPIIVNLRDKMEPTATDGPGCSNQYGWYVDTNTTQTKPIYTQLNPKDNQTSTKQHWVIVGNTDGKGVYIRGTPTMNDRLTAWPDETRFEIIGQDTEVDGQRWRKVKDPDGREGWVPAQYTIEP
jgi:hypothetical protein